MSHLSRDVASNFNPDTGEQSRTDCPHMIWKPGRTYEKGSTDASYSFVRRARATAPAQVLITNMTRRSRMCSSSGPNILRISLPMNSVATAKMSVSPSSLYGVAWLNQDRQAASPSSALTFGRSSCEAAPPGGGASYRSLSSWIVAFDGCIAARTAEHFLS